MQPTVEDIVDEIVEECAVDFEFFDFQLAEGCVELKSCWPFSRKVLQCVHDASAQFGNVFLLEARRADCEDDLRRFSVEA